MLGKKFYLHLELAPGLDYDYAEMSLNPRRQVDICSELRFVIGIILDYTSASTVMVNVLN